MPVHCSHAPLLAQLLQRAPALPEAAATQAARAVVPGLRLLVLFSAVMARTGAAATLALCCDVVAAWIVKLRRRISGAARRIL